LGWRRTHEDDDEVVLEPQAEGPEDGVVPDLVLLRVPEEKVGKNRFHLDLRPRDQAAEVGRFEKLGARRGDVGQGSDATWIVMTDPDGNEFCILRAATPQ
jgi:Glyoxalase-like domain